MQLTELLVLEVIYADFYYGALMPSMAAAGYTVASFYKQKHKPSFTGVVRLLSAAWKRMIITFLWYFIFDFIIFMTFEIALCLVVLGFLELGELGSSYSILFYVIFIVVCMVLFLVSVYVRMVWQMAIMLCILEKRYYGLEGMKKSHRLMEGKRIVGLLLAISNSGISSLLCFTAAKGNVYIVRLGSKIAYGISSTVMACAVALMGLLTQSVLYFVCKSYNGEA
ncbi:hypothetical protein SUGI_1197090 [Cryptomeria japonica]|nr:hypothetical protein SUGI_1197090 [Cryptomeria japonica]